MTFQQLLYLLPVFPETQKHFFSYHNRRGGHSSIPACEFFSRRFVIGDILVDKGYSPC
jgi:hypothetical protein